MGFSALSLAGKVAVVVGGTSGIGRAISLGLAEAGADVAASARRMEQVESTAAEIEATGRRSIRVSSDVADRGSLERLLEQTIESVMAPDEGGDQGGGNDKAAAQQQQGPPQRQAPQQQAPAPRPVAVVAPAPAAPAAPPTISIGESSSQVLQAMGMPLQMIDLGKKKTYVYKNMKIVFIDDKVSDVQ